ncbi:MAG: epoxyqueuosine reductase QueH [Candidatus Omnitrophica bacterium]|nr:epoxyqueuosine reductase QueH [Candidatus Omnitrophota bacterium]
MKSLLLHICCAPCAIYPFENLTKAGFKVEGFFYNPNIQPVSEYLKRKKSAEDLENILNIKVHYGEYEEARYADCIKSTQDKPLRCRNCFKLRLEQTRRFAAENKFDLFTTTLLVSPYQDQGMIKEIGDDISKESAAQFFFSDFRPGFRQVHNKAKELNFYCQNYCGCLFSLEEREKEKKLKKARC